MQTDEKRWAEELFGGLVLGDPRREARARRIAAALAESPGKSLPKLFAGDRAGQEAAYRFMENDQVQPEALIEGGGRGTAGRAGESAELWAVCDTTTLEFSHEVLGDDAGDLGGPAGTRSKGLWVHNILLLDGEQDGLPLGLLHQDYWKREPAKRGKRHKRKQLPYEEKESFKWERGIEVANERLTDAQQSRVVYVCDREADIYPFMSSMRTRQRRFLVRAAWNRRVEDKSEALLWEVADEAPIVATRVLTLQQRKGRKARRTELALSSGSTELRPPQYVAADATQVKVNFIYAREKTPDERGDRLEWLLLTTEPVATAEQAQRVLDIYAKRWSVEEFHKAWKSECKVEQRRLQTADNLIRMSTILAQVAVRVLALKTLAERADQVLCDVILTENETKCLVLWTKNKDRDREVPDDLTARWAYETIGRMGGWHDSKRTGRVGWQTFWEGWSQLQRMLETVSVLGLSLGDDL